MLDDANIGAAARGIVKGAFAHSGQVCMSSERVIVQARVSTPLIGAIVSLCKDLDGKVGPLFSQSSADNVVSMVKEAVEGGAELVLGDLKREHATVSPHLVKLEFKGLETGRGLRVWEKESFGPGK